MIPGVVSVTQLTTILRDLLRENISVRNFDLILQAVAEFETQPVNVRLLLEEVRIALRRVICHTLAQEGTLNVIRLDPLLDMSFYSGEREGGEVDPKNVAHIGRCLMRELSSEVSGPSALVCSRGARRLLYECLEANGSSATVLALEELSEDIELRELSVIEVPSEETGGALERLVA